MVEKITIHCSDTPEDGNFTIEDIDMWHRRKGWDGCGYHWVIHRDGTPHRGRPDHIQGAHVRGHNESNIGICLIGRNFFTRSMFEELVTLIQNYLIIAPDLEIFGHYDFDKKKTCPNFDVQEFCRKYNL